MAVFKNNLDSYITAVQTEEILTSHAERFKRHNREMGLRLGITTGAIAATTYTAVHFDRPGLLALNFASIALVNSLFNLYNFHRLQKYSYHIDYNNLDKIDYKAFSRSQREKNRYQGKMEYISPSRFYRKEIEEIEKNFGYDSANDLPIQFLPKDEVPTQVLDEYEMFNRKYDLPELKITEEELTIFVDKLEQWLKSKMLSHRIYYYTSEYFRRLLAKGLINYWDDLTTDKLISYLDCFESLEYTEEEISEFKKDLLAAFQENKDNKKLTK